MYSFSNFKEKDKVTIMEFIEHNPFAFITGSFPSGKQVATQIPIILDVRNEELFLQGHIMRKTDHHKALVENPESLVVFTGPNCYVSASWYSKPEVGSTWNYMSVHIEGRVKFMTDNELINFMRKLTLQFEEGNTQSTSFFDNLPEDYLKKMLPSIAGIEIKADNIENVFKLSQDRDSASFANIISKLEEEGDQSALIASEMKKRQSKIFPKDLKLKELKFSF